ncbi:hypothetical protein TNCV_4245421 [Trichonephila clavipes]|nr:hypothetical protein TNCV_4245421 [Trichonephila clavipes]
MSKSANTYHSSELWRELYGIASDTSREEVKIQLTGQRPMDQEIQMIKDGLAARKEELTTTLGEIALINCPIDAFVFRMSDCL